MRSLLHLLLLLLSRSILALLSPSWTYQSSLTSYAALGDSYAAGDGAGISTGTCGRFTDSYPCQIANDTFMRGVAFHNLACGGASTTSVLEGQFPWIDDSQVITLTVGGNEVDFFAVLNECIHQWRPRARGGCEAQLEKSRGLIESTDFIGRFDGMVRGLVDATEPGTRLLATGYARFFNQTTEQCDGVSFSKTDEGNKLTRDLRWRLNDLVERLNDVIRAATVAHGGEYVDLDALFEGHRFCEEGVVEPDDERTDTWFFNLHYKAKELALRGGQEALAVPFPNPFQDFLDLTKVFHPTSLGHQAIAEEVVRMLRRT